MKFNPYIVGLTLIAVLVMFGQNAAVKSLMSIDGELSQSDLLSISEHTNQSLPLMVDPDTRLDETLVEENTFVYRYTVTKYNADELTSSNFASLIQEDLASAYCEAEETKQFYESGVLLKYEYTDCCGKLAAVVVISPSDCDDS
ncbi:hypothetical protein [Corallincola spongiicola]|uniref:Uncharacterized protein n=1 Tax=Corallincola spongiicola TaxID=2520508 RepID=A0ABY1WUR8_9GAMM|nr:hypothetical protein [Corallincola spongiicola]TAA48422.1 hypothetical protein EXY25_04155 [Corallincola spongiicola]